jgi:hypothetical protein
MLDLDYDMRNDLFEFECLCGTCPDCEQMEFRLLVGMSSPQEFSRADIIDNNIV